MMCHSFKFDELKLTLYSIQKWSILIGIELKSEMLQYKWHVTGKRSGYLKKSRRRMIGKLDQLSTIERKDVTYVIKNEAKKCNF